MKFHFCCYAMWKAIFLVSLLVLLCAASSSRSPTPSRSYTSSSSRSRYPQSPSPSRSVSIYPSTSASRSGATGPACFAFPINGLTPNQNISLYGNNANYPSYYNAACGSSGNSGTVWYSVTPLANSNVTVSTCGSYTNFDTVLGVYTGSCSNPTCFLYNDDACGSGQSQVRWTATGAQYFIAVSGYSSQSGNFQLTISETKSSDIGCSKAIPIPGPYSPAVIIDSTNYGTVPTSVSGCGIAPGDYVMWYAISPQPNARLNVSTCNTVTNFDTVLSVFSGSCTNLVCSADNDDDCDNGASFISFTPTLSSYYVAVAGYSGQQGYFQLNISQANTGSSCSGAVTIPVGTSSISGSTLNGVANLSPVCSSETGAGNWYTFTATSNQQITFSTCGSANFDTILAVYGGSCSNLYCVNYNDDYCSTQSQVTITTNANTRYYLVIGGYGGATGTYTINISGIW